MNKKVTIKAFRFNAETDYLPYYKEYKIEVKKDDLILDLMNKIKWENDGSFSYRRSCRHGICGTCAIKVNSKSILPCKENAMEILALFNDEIILEPLSKKRAIKDMVIDKEDFWEKHSAVKSYVDGNIDNNPRQETIMQENQVDNFLNSDYCIQCGACHYACPVLEINEDFLGPAAFVSAFRFTIDPRDNKGKERLEITSKKNQGVWDCVKCFECTEACPKDIDPMEKITKLHNMQFEEKILQRNVATKHAEGFVRSIYKHGFLDEADIVKYSLGPIGMIHVVGDAIKMLKSGKIHFTDQLPFVDNMPKSKNLSEIQKLIKISQTNKL